MKKQKSIAGIDWISLSLHSFTQYHPNYQYPGQPTNLCYNNHIMQDLWANLSGDTLSTEAAERGGGFRQRRFTEQATLRILRAWLLEEYVLPYGTSLGNTRIFQRCYWIDALGNPGPLRFPLSLPLPRTASVSDDRRAQLVYPSGSAHGRYLSAVHRADCLRLEAGLHDSREAAHG